MSHDKDKKGPVNETLLATAASTVSAKEPSHDEAWWSGGRIVVLSVCITMLVIAVGAMIYLVYYYCPTKKAARRRRQRSSSSNHAARDGRTGASRGARPRGANSRAPRTRRRRREGDRQICTANLQTHQVCETAAIVPYSEDYAVPISLPCERPILPRRNVMARIHAEDELSSPHSYQIPDDTEHETETRIKQLSHPDSCTSADAVGALLQPPNPAMCDVPDATCLPTSKGCLLPSAQPLLGTSRDRSFDYRGAAPFEIPPEFMPILKSLVMHLEMSANRTIVSSDGDMLMQLPIVLERSLENVEMDGPPTSLASRKGSTNPGVILRLPSNNSQSCDPLNVSTRKDASTAMLAVPTPGTEHVFEMDFILSQTHAMSSTGTDEAYLLPPRDDLDIDCHIRGPGQSPQGENKGRCSVDNLPAHVAAPGNLHTTPRLPNNVFDLSDASNDWYKIVADTSHTPAVIADSKPVLYGKEAVRDFRKLAESYFPTNTTLADSDISYQHMRRDFNSLSRKVAERLWNINRARGSGYSIGDENNGSLGLRESDLSPGDASARASLLALAQRQQPDGEDNALSSCQPLLQQGCLHGPDSMPDTEPKTLQCTGSPRRAKDIHQKK